MSCQKLMGQIRSNLAQMVLRLPSNRIALINLIQCKVWLPDVGPVFSYEYILGKTF